MELNNNKKTELPASRFADIQRASETRNAELRRTVERVRDASSEMRERSEDLGRKIDSIDLSGAARGVVNETDEAHAARLERLKEAAADGSLFNRDRLAKAAERLLASEY